MYYVPVYNKFRAPARHLVETAFAISVLAGLGVAAVRRRSVSRAMSRGIILFSTVAIIAGLITLLFLTHRIQFLASERGIGQFTIVPWANPATGVPLIILFVAAIIFMHWAKSPGSARRQVLLYCVLVVDMASFGWFYEWRYAVPGKDMLLPSAFSLRYQEVLRATNQRTLPVSGSSDSDSETETGLERAQPSWIISNAIGASYYAAPSHWYQQRVNQLAPNISRLWGVPSANGYGPLMLLRVGQLLSMTADGRVNNSWAYAPDRSIDLMAVRYLFLPQNDNRVHPLPEDGISSWPKNDLNIWLGSGCATSRPRSIKFNLPYPVSASSVAVVSSMSCSTEVIDNADVARVQVTDIHEKVQVLFLRAGRDTSEWAYDCRDIRSVVKHRRASVFKSMPVSLDSGLCESHAYIANLPFGESTKIKSIELQWAGPSGTIEIKKLALLDQESRQAFYIGDPNLTVDPMIWRNIENDVGVSIYENQRALPRAWLVPEVVSVTANEALHAIKFSQLPDGRAYDPRLIALVEEPFAFKAEHVDATAEPLISHLSNSLLEVRTNSSSASFLVLSDVYYPGWLAEVDGRRTHLFLTNYALRGVAVPAGEHVVRFVFIPSTFYLGAAISALSLLTLLALLFADVARQSKKTKLTPLTDNLY
jgi:hypothetical protein